MQRNKTFKYYQADRLPIISFEIKYQNIYLYYNFISVLMNDLLIWYPSVGSIGYSLIWQMMKLNIWFNKLQNIEINYHQQK